MKRLILLLSVIWLGILGVACQSERLEFGASKCEEGNGGAGGTSMSASSTSSGEITGSSTSSSSSSSNSSSSSSTSTGSSSSSSGMACPTAEQGRWMNCTCFPHSVCESNGMCTSGCAEGGGSCVAHPEHPVFYRCKANFDPGGDCIALPPDPNFVDPVWCCSE